MSAHITSAAYALVCLAAVVINVVRGGRWRG